eukprot:7855198-Karenia_brevis.AAC.1
MIALRNAQLGQRGTIRKALDIFSWVIVLKKISLGSDKVIDVWNKEYATKDGKLVGMKRVAILNLLTAPMDGVDAMLACLARLGTDNAP